MLSKLALIMNACLLHRSMLNYNSRKQIKINLFVSSASSPDSVDVVFRVIGIIIVDYILDIIHISNSLLLSQSSFLFEILKVYLVSCQNLSG